MNPLHSADTDVTPDTLDAVFAPAQSSPQWGIVSGRKRVEKEARRVFSSTPEVLEALQFPTSMNVIPAEVSVIDDPADMVIEIAALDGQLNQTKDTLNITPLLKGDFRTEVVDAVSDADTKMQALRDLTGQAQKLDSDEQAQAGIVADLQKQLDTATQAVSDANTVLLQALANQQANQDAITNLPGQIAAQQLVVNDAKAVVAQKNKIVTDAYALYGADNLVYQKNNTDYTTYHAQFLLLQTAYQKNKTNVALKDQYNSSLAEDTRLKNVRDAAAQIVRNDTGAYNTALADRQTSSNTLTTAQQNLTLLNNQLKADKAAIPTYAAAVQAAQTPYTTAQNIRDQKQKALDDAKAVDTKMKNDLDSIFTDAQISSAKNAVHHSADLLQENTIASLQQDIDATQLQIADLQAHPEKAGPAYTMNWTTGKATETVPGTAGKETQASVISPDGKWIARGNKAGSIELIDAKTGKLAFQYTYPRVVWDMEFDPSSGRLASLSNDGVIIIIDTKTFAVSGVGVPVDNFMGNIQWLGNEICVGMQELQLFRAVNVDTGAIRTIHSIGGTEGISMMNGNILTGGSTGPIALLDPVGNVLAQAPSPGKIITVAVSDDGTLAAATTQDGKVLVYDSHLKLLASASGTGFGSRDIFLPGNTGLAIYDEKGRRFLLYSLSQLSQKTLGTPVIIPTNAHQGSSNTMSSTPGGEYLVNNDENNGIRLTPVPSQFLYSPLQKTIDTLQHQITDLQTQIDTLTPTDSSSQSFLASELSFSLQEAMEAEEPIGYAKMFVSIEPLERDVCFTVRYRVPNAHYIVEAMMTDAYGNVRRQSTDEIREPTSDASWSFHLGGAQTIQFRIRDLDTGKILATANGRCNDNNTGYIDTLQSDFEYDEPGMLAENPIVPTLKIGKIQGTTMLLVVETPHDQYVVASDMGGILGSEIAPCPDGTTFGLSKITIDAGCRTGNYQIYLLDRVGGQIIDTLTVHFDQPSHTISLLDGTDQYSKSPLDDTDAVHTLNAQQALQSVPIGLNDHTIANLQAERLYQETRDLAAPYNFYIDSERMTTQLFSLPQNALFAPENNDASVQAIWDSRGWYIDKDGNTIHLTTSDQAQSSIRRGRDQLTQTYSGYLSKYTQAMSECMQACINVFLGAVQGKPERPLVDIAQAKWDKWSKDGNVAIIGRLGFQFPSMHTMLDAAKQIFQKHWKELVEAQDDVVRFQDREQYFISLGLLKKANGEWEAANDNNSPIPPPDNMSADQIRLAARIVSIMKTSTDPRIKAITALRQQQTALRVASIPTTNPVELQKQVEQIVANAVQASAADIYVAAHPLDVQNAIQTAGEKSSLTSTELSNVFTWVKEDPSLLSNAGFDGLSLGSLATAAGNLIGGFFSIPMAEAAGADTLQFNDAIHWFDTSKSMPSFFVRQDTAISHIFLGLLQKTEGINDISIFAQYSKEIQQFTNIPWYKIGQSLEVSGQSARASNLKNLFIQAGYADIFSGASSTNQPQVLSVVPNKTDYNAGETIQVRFDVTIPDGYHIDHAFAYAVYNGQQLSNQPISMEIDDQMYVRIPVSAVQAQLQFSPNIAPMSAPIPVQIKIAVWFGKNDNLSSSMVSVGKTAEQIIKVPPPNVLLTQEEMNIIDLNIPSEFVNNQKLIQSMIANYFLGTDPNMKLEKAGNGWAAAIHGTGDLQCKQWLDEVFVMSATGIDLPSTASDQGMWVNDPKGHARQIARSDSSIDFQTAIQNGGVVAGDIVQMFGDLDGNPKTASIPHTMLIGKIEANGVWVLDTNFGDKGVWLVDDGRHKDDLTRIMGADGKARELTDEEIANHVPATLWYQSDNTIRYHFLNYAVLNREVTSASIYRLN